MLPWLLLMEKSTVFKINCQFFFQKEGRRHLIRAVEPAIPTNHPKPWRLQTKMNDTFWVIENITDILKYIWPEINENLALKINSSPLFS